MGARFPQARLDEIRDIVRVAIPDAHLVMTEAFDMGRQVGVLVQWPTDEDGVYLKHAKRFDASLDDLDLAAAAVDYFWKWRGPRKPSAGVDRMDTAARAGAEAYMTDGCTLRPDWDSFTPDQKKLARSVALAVIRSWKSTAVP